MNTIHIIVGLLILTDLLLVGLVVYIIAQLLLALPLQKSIEEELGERRREDN